MSNGLIAVSKNKIDVAISKALNFLAQNQLPYGEFKTYFFTDKGMADNCVFDSSPFATALILYCLSFLEEPKVKDITQKAVQFLVEEKEIPGLWRYWSSRNPKHKRLPPDSDAIACIAYVLKQYYSPLLYSFLFGSNKKILLNTKNEQGLFYTWILPPGHKNDVDSVVNANVLFYLGECEETKAVCDYLNHLVLRNLEKGSYPYYLSDLCLYYFMSRAYFHGALTLNKAKDAVLNKTILLQQEDGSFGDELSTALAVCTLLNYQYSDDAALERAIQSIVERQQEDGAWSKIAMWTGYFWTGGAGETGDWLAGYWGAQELTTAFCVEALVKYQLLSQKS
ncbi:MAG: hypothetical protein JO235_04630 [Chroococcidiopsidaceae cyanobacterium CP_BM_RX_35]|nr:hypothetical protein [Chroococcidiopsidaceae cyanobacterium CP_BM_RX_35]